MALYVKEGRATEVEFVPPERGASATVRVLTPSGAELSTPTATLDPFTATVAEARTSTDLALDSASGVVVGRQYWLSKTDGLGAALVRCSESFSGDDSVLLEAPPALSEVVQFDTLTGACFTTTVPAITTRGLFHRLEWTVVGADGVTRGPYVQALHVCKTLFRMAVLPDEVARYIAFTFPDVAYGRPYGYFAERARRASLRVERELLLKERFQDRIGDFDLFVEAGVVAIKLELADEGLIPPDAGSDLAQYKKDLRAEFEMAITVALAGTWYDDNDDAVVDELTEVPGGIYNIPWVRR